MTIPMWAPFAFLVGVCALPLRRVNWLAVAALGYCIGMWALVVLIVWWLIW